MVDEEVRKIFINDSLFPRGIGKIKKFKMNSDQSIVNPEELQIKHVTGKVVGMSRLLGRLSIDQVWLGTKTGPLYIQFTKEPPIDFRLGDCIDIGYKSRREVITDNIPEEDIVSICNRFYKSFDYSRSELVDSIL